ncbi:hypothetical protein RFI_08092, partial [Reticulomyxa filosa]
NNNNNNNNNNKTQRNKNVEGVIRSEKEASRKRNELWRNIENWQWKSAFQIFTQLLWFELGKLGLTFSSGGTSNRSLKQRLHDLILSKTISPSSQVVIEMDGSSSGSGSEEAKTGEVGEDPNKQSMNNGSDDSWQRDKHYWNEKRKYYKEYYEGFEDRIRVVSADWNVSSVQPTQCWEGWFDSLSDRWWKWSSDLNYLYIAVRVESPNYGVQYK